MCEPCAFDAVPANWPRAKLGGFLFGIILLFLVFTLPVMLQGIIMRDEEGHFTASHAHSKIRRNRSQESVRAASGAQSAAKSSERSPAKAGLGLGLAHKDSAPSAEESVSSHSNNGRISLVDDAKESLEAVGAHPATAGGESRNTRGAACWRAARALGLSVIARVKNFLRFVIVPLRLTIELIQLASSLQETFPHVAWPKTQRIVFSRLSALQFKLLAIPKARSCRQIAWSGLPGASRALGL